MFEELQQIISELDPQDICTELFSIVICALRFPSCNDSRGTILPLCHNVCSLVDFAFESCISRKFFRYNPRFPVVNQLLDAFVCVEPKSYYNFPIQYIDTNPSICSIISKYNYSYAYI